MGDVFGTEADKMIPDEIKKIVNELERKIVEFSKILKKNKTLIGLDELKAFFLQTQNKGE